MINRRPRQSTDPGHQADAAASQRLRLQSDKAPEALFIQNRGQLPIALSCGACLRRSNHSETLCREIPPWESRSTNSSRSVAIASPIAALRCALAIQGNLTDDPDALRLR